MDTVFFNMLKGIKQREPNKSKENTIEFLKKKLASSTYIHSPGMLWKKSGKNATVSPDFKI